MVSPFNNQSEGTNSLRCPKQLPLVSQSSFVCHWFNVFTTPCEAATPCLCLPTLPLAKPSFCPPMCNPVAGTEKGTPLKSAVFVASSALVSSEAPAAPGADLCAGGHASGRWPASAGVSGEKHVESRQGRRWLAATPGRLSTRLSLPRCEIGRVIFQVGLSFKNHQDW